jgi:hypothetical protein
MEVVQPHRPTDNEHCGRCMHHWPCPSAVAGEDLPNTVRREDPDGLPPEVHERATLAALGLVEDTGRRRRNKGRLHILWSISPKGHALAPALTADLKGHDEAPSDADMAAVLHWLDRCGGRFGTRQAVAQQCAKALDWPATHVERCLLWAEANGFVQGPTS